MKKTYYFTATKLSGESSTARWMCVIEEFSVVSGERIETSAWRDPIEILRHVKNTTGIEEPSWYDDGPDRKRGCGSVLEGDLEFFTQRLGVAKDISVDATVHLLRAKNSIERIREFVGEAEHWQLIPRAMENAEVELVDLVNFLEELRFNIEAAQENLARATGSSRVTVMQPIPPRKISHEEAAE